MICVSHSFKTTVLKQVQVHSSSKRSQPNHSFRYGTKMRASVSSTMSKPQMLANAIKSCKSSTAKGIFEDEVEGSHMEIQKNPRNSSTVVVCPGKALEFGVGTV